MHPDLKAVQDPKVGLVQRAVPGLKAFLGLDPGIDNCSVYIIVMNIIVYIFNRYNNNHIFKCVIAF